jgi:hypothetical protein
MTIPRMRDRLAIVGAIVLMSCAVSVCGCGLAYETGSRIKTSHMKDQLKVGQTTLEVHQAWGEPDMRKDLGENSQLWSYASHPNNHDLAAEVFYTSTKAGDEGKFLDLKFIDDRLVSWSEAERTMPAKKSSGFSYGIGGGSGTSPLQHY